MPVVIENNKYRVRIVWKDYNQNWNEICATAIEYFGLPGDRFSTSVCKDHMDFFFKEETDAIWFSLKCE
jgi:hypothetical protein